MIKNIAPRQWALLLGGLACGSFGIALMLRAEAGLGPWDVLHQGLSERSGISIGMVSILVSVPILLLWWPLGERPGIGTVVNTVLLGILIDVYLRFLPVQAWLPLQLGQMLVGIVLMGIGTGLYLSAQLGAGPRDGLMMGLVRRSGWSVRLIRTLLEVTVLVLGWLLGGSVGVGTLAFAFGIGPVVQATLRVVGERPAEMAVKHNT